MLVLPVLALAWIGLSVTTASARELTLPLERTCVISKDGDHRLLLALGERARLEDRYIEEAYLVLTLPAEVGNLPDTPLEIQVYGVTRAWTRAATWDGGWDRPGGDFDEDVFSRTTVRPRELTGTLRLPIDTVLRESMQGGGLHGMLVTAAPYRARGLRLEQMQLFADVVSAHVEVKWSPRPPESPARERRTQ
jgi:hypothetical protein